jgi:hypothetical protein
MLECFAEVLGKKESIENYHPLSTSSVEMEPSRKLHTEWDIEMVKTHNHAYR